MWVVELFRPTRSLLFGGVEPDNALDTSPVQACNCEEDVCKPTDIAELCHLITGEEITNQIDLYIQERSLQSRSKRQAGDDWSNIDYDPGVPNEQVKSLCVL